MHREEGEELRALSEKVESMKKKFELVIAQQREKIKQSERKIEELREQDKRSEQENKCLRDENSRQTSQLEQVDSKAFIVCSLLLCSAPDKISKSKKRM